MSADDTYDDTMRYGHDYHLGGKITRPLSDILGDSVPVLLSGGKVITDPDEAEALGLTVEARRMRAAMGEPNLEDRVRAAAIAQGLDPGETLAKLQASADAEPCPTCDRGLWHREHVCYTYAELNQQRADALKWADESVAIADADGVWPPYGDCE